MIYEYNGGNLADGLYFFYASWNSNCNVLLNRLQRLNNDFPIQIYRVNTTRYPALKKNYNITRIPSYLLIKDGTAIGRKDGNIDYFSIKSWLKERI